MDEILDFLDIPQTPNIKEPDSYEYNAEDKPKRRIALYKTTSEIIYDNGESKICEPGPSNISM